jgi:hypothetical protein
MRKPLLCLGFSLVGMVFVSGLAACSNDKSNPGVATGGQSSGGQGGQPSGGQDCKAGAPSSNHVLIDDMETTPNGPIQFTTGITAPLTPGYWYNSGANYLADAGVDMSNPVQGSFMFSALPSPTTTLSCKASAHVARQSCTLNGLYDTCGVGFEFAQQPAPDAGAPNPNDPTGGPKVTVPFDISRYKAVTFWGMTTTPDPAEGGMQVKVSFPDTDTDPRGQICNGGGGNTSKCYNSYAALLKFTTSWQQFTVKLAAGTIDMPVEGGIAIDPSWGYQQAKWIPTQVYGINWQAQKNTAPDAGPPLMTDIWVDDVYFIE